MSDAIPLIVASAAVAAVLVSIWNTIKIREVHVLVNSRLTELLTITRDASKAEGLKEGRDENRK